MAIAKSFRAPPFTPSRLTVACCAIEGRLKLYSLCPEALPNTPPAPSSAMLLPNTLLEERSLSLRTNDATSCLMYCFCVKLLPPFESLGSYGDSRTITFLLPVGSVGSIIVLIVCLGVFNPFARRAISVALSDAIADLSFSCGLTNDLDPSGFSQTPPIPATGKLCPVDSVSSVPKLVGLILLNLLEDTLAEILSMIPPLRMLLSYALIFSLIHGDLAMFLSCSAAYLAC